MQIFLPMVEGRGERERERERENGVGGGGVLHAADGICEQRAGNNRWNGGKRKDERRVHSETRENEARASSRW